MATRPSRLRVVTLSQKNTLFLMIITLFVCCVNTDLLLTTDVLENVFWCPRSRCCMAYDEEIWDLYDYDHTNECETAEDCIFVAAALNGCGHLSVYGNAFYNPSTRFECIEMGDEGRSFCTIGCSIHMFSTEDCSEEGVEYDMMEGTDVSCRIYYNDETGLLEPDCPCFIANCNEFTECPEHPVLQWVPLPDS